MRDAQHASWMAQLVRECRAVSSQGMSAARQDSLERWFADIMARMDDEVYPARLARAHPVLDTRREDYGVRVLRSEGSATLLAGVDFDEDGSAFVRLLAWDRPIPDTHAWQRVLERLVDAFAVFRTRWVHVRLPGHRVPRVPRQRRRVDQWLVSGPLATLRSQSLPWGWHDVEVHRAEQLDFYRSYASALASWKDRVGLRGRDVKLATETELAACLQTGAVVCAYRDGAWAGVGAAARDEERLVHGYRIHAFFLDTPLRGQRRAPVLQRHLIEAVPDGGDDSLFGTIDGTNVASLRAAQRCGRDVLETWWWLRVA